MINEDNLIPMSEKTKEEQRKIASMGGKASGKAKRERKAMREQLEYLMTLKLNKNQDKLKSQLKKLGISTAEANMQMAINVALFQQALKGNVKAYEIIRDTLGEKPIEQIQNMNPPIINIQKPSEGND